MSVTVPKNEHSVELLTDSSPCLSEDRVYTLAVLNEAPKRITGIVKKIAAALTCEGPALPLRILTSSKIAQKSAGTDTLAAVPGESPIRSTAPA